MDTNSVIFQRLGQPIQDRHREQEDRPRAFEELGKKMQLYMKIVDSYKQKVHHFDGMYCMYIQYTNRFTKRKDFERRFFVVIFLSQFLP